MQRKECYLLCFLLLVLSQMQGKPQPLLIFRLSLDQQVLGLGYTLAQYSDLKLLEGMLCCHLCFCTNLCLGLPLRIVGYCWSDNSDNPIYVGESTLFSEISRPYK
jgi:hypothetical protein